MVPVLLGLLLLITIGFILILWKKDYSFQKKTLELQIRLEQAQSIEQAQQKLSDTFKSISAEALVKNNQNFVSLAQVHLEKWQTDLSHRQDHLVKLVDPLKESLQKVNQKMEELEKSRVRADESIFQQVQALIETQKELRTETSNLITALRAPQGRGQWGEIQLKRVVEMAGMIEHCDFAKQESIDTDEGKLRPDLIVKLPGGKNVVVDSKAPLLAYLDSLQQKTFELKVEKLQEHARQVRRHIEQLSRKSYWEQFQPAPEFVVLFLPGEAFFSAALEQDPSLIELGVSQNVIMATPTTLIALLRAVAYGWRQEKIAENAKAIGELGRELYKRLSDMGGHLQHLGKNLESAVDAYNRSIGTLESRVFVTARKFRELDSSETQMELTELSPIEINSRALNAPEIQNTSEKEC